MKRTFFGETTSGRVWRVLVIAVLVPLSYGLWVVAAVINEASPVVVHSQETTLAKLTAEWAAHPAIPGVILRVSHNGQTVYAGASGTTEKSGGDSLTPDTPFHTASVGKLFTAIAVLRLAERGLLDLDQTASFYLGPEVLAPFGHFDGEHYGDAITIRQLIAHRAGLGNTDDDLRFGLTVLFNPRKQFVAEDLLAAAARVPAPGPPGAQESYASPGYYLAGLVIEKVTGRRYHEVVREEVLAPLRMVDTYEANAEWEREIPYLHHYAGWTDLSRHDPSFEFADGGFVTTTSDLARFGQAFLDRQLFRDAATHDAFTAPWPGIQSVERHRGLGPGVVRLRGDPVLVWHSGYWGVYFLMYPNSRTIASMTFAQSRADYLSFWAQAKPLVEQLIGHELETGTALAADLDSGR